MTVCTVHFSDLIIWVNVLACLLARCTQTIIFNPSGPGVPVSIHLRMLPASDIDSVFKKQLQYEKSNTIHFSKDPFFCCLTWLINHISQHSLMAKTPHSNHFQISKCLAGVLGAKILCFPKTFKQRTRVTFCITIILFCKIIFHKQQKTFLLH